MRENSLKQVTSNVSQNVDKKDSSEKVSTIKEKKTTESQSKLIKPRADKVKPPKGSVRLGKGTMNYFFGPFNELNTAITPNMADSIPNLLYNTDAGENISMFFHWEDVLSMSSNAEFYYNGKKISGGFLSNPYSNYRTSYENGVVNHSYTISDSNGSLDVVATARPTGHGTIKYNYHITNTGRRTADISLNQRLDTKLAIDKYADDHVPVHFIGGNRGLYFTSLDSTDSGIRKYDFQLYFVFDDVNGPSGWQAMKYPSSLGVGKKGQKDGDNPKGGVAFNDGDSVIGVDWYRQDIPVGGSYDAGWEAMITPPGNKPELTLDQAPIYTYSGGDLALSGTVKDKDNVGQDEIVKYSINDGPEHTLTTVKNSSANTEIKYSGTVPEGTDGLKIGDVVSVWAVDPDNNFSLAASTWLVTPPGTFDVFTKKVKNVTAGDNDYQAETNAQVGDELEYAVDLKTASDSTEDLKELVLKDVLNENLQMSGTTIDMSVNGGAKTAIPYNSTTGEIVVPSQTQIKPGSSVRFTFRAILKTDKIAKVPNTIAIIQSSYGTKTTDPANVNVIQTVNMTAVDQDITNLTTGEGKNQSLTEISGYENDAIQFKFNVTLEGSENAVVKELNLVTQENATEHTDAAGALTDPRDYKVSVDGQNWIATTGTATSDGVKVAMPDSVSVRGGQKVQIEYTKTIQTIPTKNHFIYNDGIVSAANTEPESVKANATKIKFTKTNNLTVRHQMKKMPGSDTDTPALDLGIDTQVDEIFAIHSHAFGNYFEDYYDIKADDDNDSSVPAVLKNYQKAYYQKSDDPAVSGQEAPIEIIKAGVEPKAYLMVDGKPTKDISGAKLTENIRAEKEIELSQVSGNLTQDIDPGTEIAIIIPRQLATHFDATTGDSNILRKILENHADIGGTLSVPEDMTVTGGINKNNDGSNAIAPDFNKVTLRRPKTGSTLVQTVTNKSHPNWDESSSTATKGKAGDTIHYDFEIRANSDNEEVIGLAGLKDLGSDSWESLDLVRGSLRFGPTGTDKDPALGVELENQFINEGTVLNPNETTSIKPGEVYHLSYNAKLKYSEQTKIINNDGTAVNASGWYPFSLLPNNKSNVSFNHLMQPWLFNQRDADSLDEKTQPFNTTHLTTDGAHYTLFQDVKNVTIDSEYSTLQNARSGDTLRYRYAIDVNDLNQYEGLVNNVINNIKRVDEGTQLDITTYQTGSLKVQYGDNGPVESLADPADLTKISLPRDIEANQKVYIYYDVAIANRIASDATIKSYANFSVHTQGPDTFNVPIVSVKALSDFSVKQTVKNKDEDNSGWQTEIMAVPGETVSYRYEVTADYIVPSRNELNMAIRHIVQTPKDNMVFVPGSVKISYYNPDGSLDKTTTGDLVVDNDDVSKKMVDVGNYTYQTKTKLIVTYDMTTSATFNEPILNDAEILDDDYDAGRSGRVFKFNQTKVTKQDKSHITIRYMDADSPMNSADNNLVAPVTVEGSVGHPLSEVTTEQLTPKEIEGWTPVEQNFKGTPENNSDWQPVENTDPRFTKADQVILYRYKKAMLGIKTPKDWDFGNYQPSSRDKTYFLKTKDASETKNVPHGVLVYDYYNTQKWQLNVQQIGKFVTTDGTSELEGTKILLKNGNIQHVAGTDDQDGTNGGPTVTNSDTVELTPDGDSVNLMSYDKTGYHYGTPEKDQPYEIPGWGLWRYQFGDQAKGTMDSSVGLFVPGSNRPVKDKQYTSKLRWTVTDAE